MSGNVVERTEGPGRTKWSGGQFVDLTNVESIKEHGETKWHGGRVEETKGPGGAKWPGGRFVGDNNDGVTKGHGGIKCHCDRVVKGTKRCGGTECPGVSLLVSTMMMSPKDLEKPNTMMILLL